MTLLAWLCSCLLLDGQPADIHFDTRIMPVLTKAGCNAGACHGAAAGRGGFHLSLLGADPTADYQAIVLELEGRRINPAHPEKSLLLLKPTGYLDHGGDLVLDESGAGARRILSWIRNGAPRGAARRLTHFEVTPRRELQTKLPAAVKLTAIACFDNGPPEDVTEWTAFTSTDPVAVVIGHDHTAHLNRRGQHVVIARFLDQVVPLQFTVPLSDARVDHSLPPGSGFIDEQIIRVLTELQLPISPPASDTAWLRRVSLDLTGRLPDPQLVESYAAETSSEKRMLLIDRLLFSDSFTDYWTLKYSRLLRMHSLPNEEEGLQAYVDWLRNEIDSGTPLNHMAHQLLTATGDSHVAGPANFGRMVSDPRSHAELIGQFFMGMRLGCANCHNHPLDQWTQDDYHGLAAIFARLERGREVKLSMRGAVTNLRTNEPAVPRIPAVRDLPTDGDHREAVYDWVIAGEQNYFARATVNRLWQAMFGRGLVDPIDDMRATNPATHPELLTMLAEDFVANGYNMRHTLRQIALSDTYARSDATVPGNELDDRFYSHIRRRPLEPEVLVDAVSDVTGLAHTFAGSNATRAVRIVDPLLPAPALDVLGRCNQIGGCETTSSGQAGLPAQLHLLNGDLINQKLNNHEGRLKKMIAAGHSNESLVNDFFLRGLSRRPTDVELMNWLDRLEAEDAEQRTEQLEDFVWSLLNSRQFREK